MEKKTNSKTTTKKRNNSNKKESTNRKNSTNIKSSEKRAKVAKTGITKRKSITRTIKPIETTKVIKEKKHKEIDYKKYITKKNIIIGLFCIILIIFMCFILKKDGGTTTIEFESDPDPVYEWRYEIEDESIVKFVEKTETKSSEGKDKKDVIKEKYVFQAKNKGKTVIKFIFTNKNNGSSLGRKTYEAKVDKDLKLTIEEKKYN